MYKCTTPFTASDNKVYLLEDEIEWVEFASLSKDEQDNFQKIEEND